MPPLYYHAPAARAMTNENAASPNVDMLGGSFDMSFASTLADNNATCDYDFGSFGGSGVPDTPKELASLCPTTRLRPLLALSIPRRSLPFLRKSPLPHQSQPIRLLEVLSSFVPAKERILVTRRLLAPSAPQTAARSNKALDPFLLAIVLLLQAKNRLFW